MNTDITAMKQWLQESANTMDCVSPHYYGALQYILQLEGNSKDAPLTEPANWMRFTPEAMPEDRQRVVFISNCPHHPEFHNKAYIGQFNRAFGATFFTADGGNAMYGASYWMPADDLLQAPVSSKRNDDDESTDYECLSCGKLNYKPLGCGNCGLEFDEASLAAPVSSHPQQEPAYESSANTMAGFKGGFYCEHRRNPTEQEIWNAGVASGIRRAAPVSAPQPVSDEQIKERMVAAGFGFGHIFNGRDRHFTGGIKEARALLAQSAGQSSHAKDAERYRKAIAYEDNADLLYRAVLNHGSDKASVDAEFDAEAIAKEQQ